MFWYTAPQRLWSVSNEPDVKKASNLPPSPPPVATNLSPFPRLACKPINKKADDVKKTEEKKKQLVAQQEQRRKADEERRLKAEEDRRVAEEHRTRKEAEDEARLRKKEAEARKREADVQKRELEEKKKAEGKRRAEEKRLKAEADAKRAEDEKRKKEADVKREAERVKREEARVAEEEKRKQVPVSGIYHKSRRGFVTLGMDMRQSSPPHDRRIRNEQSGRSGRASDGCCAALRCLFLSLSRSRVVSMSIYSYEERTRADRVALPRFNSIFDRVYFSGDGHGWLFSYYNRRRNRSECGGSSRLNWRRFPSWKCCRKRNEPGIINSTTSSLVKLLMCALVM